jgi:hypothetical protein
MAPLTNVLNGTCKHLLAALLQIFRPMNANCVQAYATEHLAVHSCLPISFQKKWLVADSLVQRIAVLMPHTLNCTV